MTVVLPPLSNRTIFDESKCCSPDVVFVVKNQPLNINFKNPFNMAPDFPTQFEMRCGGCSFILGSILPGIALYLQQIDHDMFNTATDDQVIILHNKVSSTEHRTKVEISAALLWLTFPLTLAALNTINKMMNIALKGTPGSVFQYSLPN